MTYKDVVIYFTFNIIELYVVLLLLIQYIFTPPLVYLYSASFPHLSVAHF